MNAHVQDMHSVVLNTY